MKRSNAMSKKVSVWVLALNILLILTLIPTVHFNSARAQDSSDGTQVEVGTAEAVPVGVEKMEWSAEVPTLTAEQEAQLAYWSERTNLPGPERPGSALEAAAVAAPAADTATEPPGRAPSPRAPLAPGDMALFRKNTLGTIDQPIPSNFKSNVMESSVGQGGKHVFYTGNWFAAWSYWGGTSWFYANPFSGFGDFCCDQVATYDESRNVMYWLRMGVPNASGVNRFRLGASGDGGGNFCNYDFTPTNTNGTWTNQWWDYPHMQLGSDYLYIAWNMFNASDQWTRTVMLRLPLDALRNCAAFQYNYYAVTDWFTFVPVQGADHTMWFASNYALVSPFNRLRIWRWHEDSGSLTFWDRTVTAWNYTGRGQAICNSTTANWAARTDDRLLSGARYMINNTDLKYPGRTVLGWWWNVKQGGGFPQPYVDGAAFFEDTLTQVPGAQGRPYIYSGVGCWLYPSFAANKRGDLGFAAHGGFGTVMPPNVYAGIADDYTAAPPGFSVFQVQGSNARPSDNKWGDYNTVRAFLPTGDIWTGASHYIPGSSNCATCSNPVFFNFGRTRDFGSQGRWYKK
jgi:hypothetical protein